MYPESDTTDLIMSVWFGKLGGLRTITLPAKPACVNTRRTRAIVAHATRIVSTTRQHG